MPRATPSPLAEQVAARIVELGNQRGLVAGAINVTQGKKARDSRRVASEARP